MILKNNNSYIPLNDGTILNVLEKGVYELEQDENRNFILSKKMDSFLLPKKLYGIKMNIIDRILKYYEFTDSNLGILLDGLKGTGKTVMSKIIANKIGVPVITINKSFGVFNENIISFLSLFKQNIIIILDEFEKTFEDDSFILKLMDGLYNNEHKKLFMLTTNSCDNIDVNLLNRPSRIRYKVNFDSLDEESIIEILNDRLNDKSNIDKVIDICNTFSILSIDILNSLIDEINLFGINSDLSILNISKSTYKNSFIEINTYKELSKISKKHRDIIYGLNNISTKNETDLADYLSKNKITDEYDVHMHRAYKNIPASKYKIGDEICDNVIIDIVGDLYVCEDMINDIVYYKLVSSHKTSKDFINK